MENVKLALPDPRSDGLCAECGRNPAITTDRRFCNKCLKALIAKISPGSTTHGFRSDQEREDRSREPSPWQEDAIRRMEGD
mgnify:CR=1 FL=1